jgi:hypothetical protein
MTTATAFSDTVSGVSPLGGDAIDGSARPAPRRRRAAAVTEPAGSAVYDSFHCPECDKPIPGHAATRHLLEHVNDLKEQNTALEERASAVGLEGAQTRFDELGNLLVIGPGEAARNPVLWLLPDDITIDAGVQRPLESNHPLFRPGATFDPNKAGAVTVAPVYAPGSDGHGGTRQVLIGYRAVDGQHRREKARRDRPRARMLCKLTSDAVESRAEESEIARLMATGQSAFRDMHLWHSLVREEQPNIVAAAELLRRKGYVVTNSPGKSSAKAIAAAGALLRIAGVPDPSGPSPRVTKDPQDGVRDLSDVMEAIEGIRLSDGEGSRRNGGMLLKLIYSILDDNRGVRDGRGVDVKRLARAMGTHSVDEWLTMARQKELGGRSYLRERICREYGKSLPKNSLDRIR